MNNRGNQPNRSSDVERSNQAPKTPRDRRGWLETLIWLFALVIAVPLVVSIVRLQLAKSKTISELTAERELLREGEAELVELEAAAQAVQTKVARESQLNRSLRTIYQQYRDVDDIPDYTTPFVVHSRGFGPGPVNSTLVFTLPEGKLTLQILLRRTDAAKELIDEKRLEYELIGASGYFVEFALPQEAGKKYRDPRQLTLHITSNSEQFEPIAQALYEPFPPPSSSGSSSAGLLDHAAFPNEYYPNAKGRGLLLNSAKWSVVPDEPEQRFDLHYEIRLLGGGPRVASPTTANRLKYAQDEIETTYAGEGKFLLIEDEE